MDLTAYYPVLIVLGIVFLFIIVIVGAFLVGKRKYNAANGVVKEKKVKEKKIKEKKTGEKKSKADIKLSEKDAAAIAAFEKSRKEENDDDREYEKAVNTLKNESLKNKQVIEGPVIVVNENKPKEKEEIIEWKPPAEEKEDTTEKDKTAAYAATDAASKEQAAAIPEKPAGNEWNDEDLELFEARTYSFDEETQSGYMKKVKEQKPADTEIPAETSYVYRERREQIHDPANDEGVQVFETFEKNETAPTPAPAPAEEPKISNSKYAYFDSVMEKEKGQKGSAEWQPPQKKGETAPTEEKSENKSKKAMQYIELDLDNK